MGLTHPRRCTHLDSGFGAQQKLSSVFISYKRDTFWTSWFRSTLFGPSCNDGMKFFLHVVKIGEFEWVSVVIIRSSRRNSTWSISIPLYKNFFVYVLSCRVMNECARFAHAWNTDDQETHRAHIPTRRVTDFATSRLQKIFGFTLNVNNKIFLFTNQLETFCKQKLKLFSSIKLEVAWSSLTSNFFVRLIAKRSWSTRLMHTLKISPRRIRNSTSRLAWSPIPPRANKKILWWHHDRVGRVISFPLSFQTYIAICKKKIRASNKTFQSH